MLYRNRKKESKKMAHDFSNEFNLDDSVDRDVAIWRAATLNRDIKELEEQLKWFKNGFRDFFANGGEENGRDGSKVKVTAPNKERVHLDTDYLKKMFPVDDFFAYYKKDKDDDKKLKKTVTAQSVTFTIKL